MAQEITSRNISKNLMQMADDGWWFTISLPTKPEFSPVDYVDLDSVRSFPKPIPAVQNSSSDQGMWIGNGKSVVIASESFGAHEPVSR